MIAYKDIRDVHLEISTLCNASCPWCPRNFWGYPFNGGYPELYLTCEHAKKIFCKDFLKQLKNIRINGNFGDIVMNPDALEIIEYFKSCNHNLRIKISSNAGARDSTWWKKLASLGAEVFFAIDGLEDTHSLYRQNTIWSTVMRNAKTFIDAGGKAHWQMIKFKHNIHQITQCQALSKKIGFKRFIVIDDGRNTAPVFDKNGKLTHTLGNYKGETDFNKLLTRKMNDTILLEDIIEDKIPSDTLDCETQRMKSIYIAANGDVSPCCYMGFYPQTYGKGQYREAANKQLLSLIKENNALTYSIEHCISWFSTVEKRWKEKNYKTGRLVICDDHCGSCEKNINTDKGNKNAKKDS